MKRDIQGIVFDKDGTLIDFHNTWPPAFRSVAERLAAPLAVPGLADRLLAAGGQDPETDRITSGTLLAEGTTAELVECWLSVEPRLADLAETADGETVSDWLCRHLDASWTANALGAVRSVTDLSALFGTLRASGIYIGVATNDVEEAALETTRQFDVQHHVAFHAGYDSGHGAKPEPGMILAFCQHVGLDPATVAMVGDNPADARAGRAAGCGLVIGVLTGPSERAMLEGHTDVVLDSIADVPALLGLS